MTTTDQAQARSADRLDLLNRLTDDMDEFEARAFQAHLIGGLSYGTPAEVWDRVVAAALGDVERSRSRRLHPSAEPESD